MHITPIFWQGRIDGVTEEHLRWHQIIELGNLQDTDTDYGIVGFECDEGVLRNKGRVGAKKGPDFLRKACANFPKINDISIADFGNVVCEKNDIEICQNELAKIIEILQAKAIKTIVFGGGHEVLFGHYSGLRAAFPHEKIGIINFDAHFDNRSIDPAVGATSGTGFWQIAQLDSNYNYLAIGIQQNSNTKALFDETVRTKTEFILGDDFFSENQEYVSSRIDTFIENIDVLYVTFCLDVFAAAFAPGVSATAYNGLFPDFFFKKIFKKIISSSKLKAFDIAELNPDFDIDNRTAKLAASLVFELLNCNATA